MAAKAAQKASDQSSDSERPTQGRYGANAGVMMGSGAAGNSGMFPWTKTKGPGEHPGESGDNPI